MNFNLHPHINNIWRSEQVHEADYVLLTLTVYNRGTKSIVIKTNINAKQQVYCYNASSSLVREHGEAAISSSYNRSLFSRFLCVQHLDWFGVLSPIPCRAESRTEGGPVPALRDVCRPISLRADLTSELFGLKRETAGFPTHNDNFMLYGKL